jgi:hypothetical protein
VTLRVVGSVFAGPHRLGDFAWMVQQPEWDDDLFVFNDNEEQFRAFRRDPSDPAGCARGGGNAAIRPYRCQQPPRVAGVPTGSRGAGYEALTPPVQAVIDDAFAVIRELVASGRFQRVVYSAETPDGTVGTGIFTVGPDVTRYITEQLRILAS